MSNERRTIGFCLGLLSCALTVVNLIAYNCVPFDIYNFEATLWSAGGIAAFIILSIFRRTSEFAPLLLMVSNFMGLMAFVQASGTIDYFTTHFFDGFSLDAFFALPIAVWGSILTFIASFAVSSVAMYFPMVKK